MSRFFYILFCCFLVTVLAGCGGSSNSGGPPPIEVTPGVYEGTLELTYTFDGESASASGGFSLTVAGTGLNQQVIIAYREFSGSSAVGANQEFRIPSGRFNFPIGIEGVNCTQVLVFDGRFVGQTASGTVEGTVNCNPGNLTLDIGGTFTATLGLGKAPLEESAPEEGWAAAIKSLLQ